MNYKIYLVKIVKDVKRVMTHCILAVAWGLNDFLDV